MICNQMIAEEVGNESNLRCNSMKKDSEFEREKERAAPPPQQRERGEVQDLGLQHSTTPPAADILYIPTVALAHSFSCHKVYSHRRDHRR